MTYYTSFEKSSVYKLIFLNLGLPALTSAADTINIKESIQKNSYEQDFIPQARLHLKKRQLLMAQVEGFEAFSWLWQICFK